MPVNLPGSKLLQGLGSYLNIISPYNGSMTRLDVAWYEPDEQIKTGPNKGHSGSNGYPVRRLTGADSAINLHLWWDAANSPRTTLNSYNGWGCGAQLGVSNLLQFQNYGFTQQQFFILLSGILTNFRTRASSQAEDGEDGIVTADAVLRPNATRLFLLPDENAAYAIEVNRLQTAGQLNALNTFATMQ